jgi:hypothetical protein
LGRRRTAGLVPPVPGLAAHSARWLKALEQPTGGGRLFLDDAYISSFRYLPAPAGEAGDHLPVGFAADTTAPANLTKTNLQWKSRPVERRKMGRHELRRLPHR